MSKFYLSFLLLLSFAICSCDSKPDAIKVGKDNCAYCKMTISNARFGAEVITKKGKIYKYDELHCIMRALEDSDLLQKNIQEIYLSDFCGNHKLVSSSAAYFLQSQELKSPMGGDIATFSNQDSLLSHLQKLNGKQVNWNQIFP
jgi:copper chaperone NosL